MADEMLNDLAELCAQRDSTYALLARLYRVEVDQPLLDGLHATRFPAVTGSTKANAGYRALAEYLSNIDERSTTELAVDFARVFIGYGVDSYAAAFPFESVYTSEKRLKMQEARDEVLAIYRSQALDKSKTWKESEDHVAMECEFMAAMAKRTADACREGDEDKVASLLLTQHNFLADHLYAWTGMMTSDMRKFARTDFYKGLADYTDGFLESDFDLLKNVLGIEDEIEDVEAEPAAEKA